MPLSSPPDLLTQEDTSGAPVAALTAGQMLRQAREAQGTHLAVLAVKLKVPVRQLEALEADRYDTFKGGTTFLRAITSSMCRQLGVDAAPILALLPSAVSSMPARKPLSNASSGLPRGTLPTFGLPRRGHPVLILVALMLLGAAAFLWLPAPQAWWPQALSTSPVAVTEEAAVPMGQPANPESTDASMPAPAAMPAAPTSVVTAPVATPTPATAPTPSSALPLTAPPNSPTSGMPEARKPIASNAASAALVPGILVLQATADSWIEVHDANGPVVRKLLKSGESLEVKHPVAYSVVVGRPLAVKATLRGQVFDLTPHTQQTVARFEVKE